MLLEAQEHYTDQLAGTINVEGVTDTVNDLLAGLIGGVVYPLVYFRVTRPSASTSPPLA